MILPEPIFQHNNEDNISLLKGLSDFLEDIYSPLWLSKQAHYGKTHPAVVHWSLCQEFLKSNGVLPWERIIKVSPILAEAFTSAFWLSVASGGNADPFTLGNFSNYGNPKIVERLKTEAKTPSGYRGVMTELIFAGWCAANKVSAVASDAPRVADFVVRDSSGTDEYCVECKSIDISPLLADQVKKKLTKANKQIKATSDKLPGVALVHLNKIWTNNFSDLGKQPAEVTEVVTTIEQALNTHLRSVSAVVILWDEHNLRESKKNPMDTHVILRRHSLWIQHQTPRLLLPNVPKLQELGFGLTFIVPKLPVRNILKWY